MSTIGHNKGPTMERGGAWRRHCWSTSRKALLPTLPLPVIKRRLKRALELGLDYKSYATVRATTGRDIIALLFSQNALRLDPAGCPSPSWAAHLRQVGPCSQIIALQGADAPSLDATFRSAGITVHHAAPAPIFVQSEPQRRAALDALKAGYPSDAVLLIGETDFERSWCATGRLAGYVPAETYFPRTG